MLVSEMLAELYDDFGQGDNPPPAVANRFLRYLNRSYQTLMSKRGMMRLRRVPLTFSSVANTPYAVLPQAATKIITIYDRTNRRVLDEIDLRGLRYVDPGQAQSVSVPGAYTIDNLSAPTARIPTAACELFLKSTSAVDGGAVDVTVSGIITGGYEAATHGPMNGVTATTLDAGITTWEYIRKFRLNQPAKGTITLLQGSGVGTELGRIAPGKTSSRYTRIQLYPVPSVAVVYNCDVELALEELTSVFDEPLIPDDYAWLLPCGARMREYKKREKMAEFAAEKADWASGAADLQAHLRQATGVPEQSGKRPRFSQLGPWFPQNT